MKQKGYVYEDNIFQGAVSAYERGTREPALPVWRSHARVAELCVDVLIDDELDLTEKLPSRPKHTR